MIPLYYVLIAWVVLLGIFGFMTLLTLLQMLRHGLPTPSTYVSTFFFLAVIALVVLGVGAQLTTVNWAESVSVLPGGAKQATDTYLLGL